MQPARTSWILTAWVDSGKGRHVPLLYCLSGPDFLQTVVSQNLTVKSRAALWRLGSGIALPKTGARRRALAARALAVMLLKSILEVLGWILEKKR